MSPAQRGRRRRGRPIGESWWSQRFLAVLESFDSGFRAERGRDYARRGRVRNLSVEPGELRAVVQGSRRMPYSVRVTYPPVPAEDWLRVERAMAHQALFAARLLAGELPHEAVEVFQSLDVPLFPDDGSRFRSSCTCPDEVNPCKHIAALFYAFAEALDRDPFLLFRWRGRPEEALIADLRALRAGEELPEGGPEAVEHGVGRERARRSTFWEQEVDLDTIPIHPAAAEVPDGLLRQLGPTGVRLADQDLMARLGPLYQAIVADALRRSLGDAERPPDTPEQ
ncbi:MAG: SWIM zinc finger family protein [Candidatus Dormibacteraeota bacterium]|nr:SWIM zinc finger family protein [Candidatus Dormibacteraeota bacterium]